MANIRVSFDEMESTATQLGAARDEIAQKLQSLQGLINSLVSSGFVTDQASSKFNTAYSEYTSGASIVINRLTDIQQFLTQSAGAMRDMDAQIASRIS